MEGEGTGVFLYNDPILRRRSNSATENYRRHSMVSNSLLTHSFNQSCRMLMGYGVEINKPNRQAPERITVGDRKQRRRVGQTKNRNACLVHVDPECIPCS